MARQDKRVLVTGASGYIAQHCIKELLKNGYKVTGSLRDLSKESEIRKNIGIKFKEDNLLFCELDLLKEDGWERAASNCSYLFHIASPCVIKEPKNEYEIIKQKLLPIIENLDVDTLDMTPILVSKGGVKKLYHNPKSHYNKNGYRIVSEEIKNRLLINYLDN